MKSEVALKKQKEKGKERKFIERLQISVHDKQPNMPLNQLTSQRELVDHRPCNSGQSFILGLTTDLVGISTGETKYTER